MSPDLGDQLLRAGAADIGDLIKLMAGERAITSSIRAVSASICAVSASCQALFCRASIRGPGSAST